MAEVAVPERQPIFTEAPCPLPPGKWGQTIGAQGIKSLTLGSYLAAVPLDFAGYRATVKEGETSALVLRRAS